MSKQRQKGTAFETLIVEYLRDTRKVFPNASRSPLHGNKDTGDTMNTEPFVIEMKNQRQMSLGAWVDESLLELGNAKQVSTGYPVVIHKRKGRGWAGHQFATMELAFFVDLMEEVVNARRAA